MMARLSPLCVSLLTPVAAFALFSTVSIAGCGVHGKTGTPEGSDRPWAEMDESQRMAHMGEVVMPRMQAVFEGFDAERFSDFSCSTCHGGARDGDFSMPNPGLPTLYSANFYKYHRKHQPDITKLMWKEVEPALGEALAVTHGMKGAVSCASCHVVDDGPAPD